MVDIFNSQHPRLKFTFEVEDNGMIPFLDVLMIHEESKITTDWYYKPTWSERYLNYFSHHPLTQKKGVIFMLVDRAWKLSHKRFLRKNLDLIFSALRRNDYPMDFIAYWMNERIKHLKDLNCNPRPIELSDKPIIDFNKKLVLPYAEGLTQNLQRMIRKHGLALISSNNNKFGSFIKFTKDSLDTMSRITCVYSVPCNNCNGTCVGQTKRVLNIRINEHKRNPSLPPKQHTAMTKHAIDNDRRILYDNARVLGHAERPYGRNLSEMYYITKDKNAVNFRSDVDRLSGVYSAIIK